MFIKCPSSGGAACHMSPLTGLGFNQITRAINIPPRRSGYFSNSPLSLSALLLREAPAQLLGAFAYLLAEAEDAGEVAAGLRGLLQVDHARRLEDRVPGEAVHQRVEPAHGRPQSLRRLYL